MPGSIRRPVTSYDVYEGYDVYPSDYQQRNGAITPVYDINNYGRLSPASGKQSPMFPRAKSELSRPPSQNNIATQYMDLYRQTDSRLGYDTYLPPPSPARIDRSFTMYPIEGERMDPFTKQYYERLWRNEFAPKDPNLYRQGRAGGRWRHISACTANTGSHITFVEGTVKQVDNIGKRNPQYRSSFNQHYMSVPRPPARSPSPKRKQMYNTQFNQRAKNGFKYWYQEQKPIDQDPMFHLLPDEINA